MRRAGVEILAGTDALNPFVYPGFGLHDELALLVQGGLSPLEALQAATLAPARFLGATDSLGTVERGKIADLVVLEANPLADIHNTTRIRAVVANGRLYTRAALDSLLANVERAVAGPGR
jgi:imidazolonepropionase-like amidohydrolase